MLCVITRYALNTYTTFLWYLWEGEEGGGGSHPLGRLPGGGEEGGGRAWYCIGSCPNLPTLALCVDIIMPQGLEGLCLPLPLQTHTVKVKLWGIHSQLVIKWDSFPQYIQQYQGIDFVEQDGHIYLWKVGHTEHDQDICPERGIRHTVSQGVQVFFLCPNVHVPMQARNKDYITCAHLLHHLVSACDSSSLFTMNAIPYMYTLPDNNIGYRKWNN